MEKKEKTKRRLGGIASGLKSPRSSVVVRAIGVVVIILFIFSILVSIIGYREFSDNLMYLYVDGAFRTADVAMSNLDPDRMDAYVESGGTGEEYQAVWTSLDRICNETDSAFVYVIRPDLDDYAHITFVFSTLDHDSPYPPYQFGTYRDTTNDEYREKYKRLYDGESDRETVVRDRGYIETDPHITAMLPVRGADGRTQGILCVQRQMDILARVRKDYLKKIRTILLGLCFIVIIGESFFINRIFLSPLTTIYDEAARFSREGTLPEVKLSQVIRNRDEIGLLAVAIESMEEEILEYMENLTAVTREKERISTELNLATKIQANVLPNTFPAFPDRPEFDIYACMEPA